MDNKEFLNKCRPLCEEYGKIFGYSPCPSFYSCSEEEFYEALKKAVKEHKEIKEYVPRKGGKVWDDVDLW